MDPVFIRWFSELSRQDILIAGGKGASLGELTRAGIPVPPGFVILTDAFQQFLELADLHQEIELALKDIEIHDQSEIDRVSAYLSEQILQTPFEEEFVREIQRAFKDLNAPFVAVRSSATVEDGSEAAWAGQLESYLNTTEETLIVRVKDCFASLFSPRAIFYRLQHGLKTEDIAVAVVIQKMIESDRSGIAFSVHPVTQDREQMVIEAGYGLGESIVSGQVTPATYVVTKRSGRVLEKTEHHQERGVYRAEHGGNEWRVLSPEQKTRDVLNEEEISALADLILKIETHYHVPVDVEWAKEGNRFFILQSRPITTLSPPSIFPLLKQRCWTFYLSRRFNWFVQSIQMQAMEGENQARFVGSQFSVQNYLILNGDEYFCEEDGKKTHEQFSDAFTRDRGFFQRFAQREEQILAEAESYTNSFRHQNFEETTVQGLVEALKQFSERYLASFIPAWVRPDTFLETEVQRLLKEELGLDDETALNVFSQIATPLHPALCYVDEPLALLMIAKRIRDFHGSLDASVPIVEELLSKHQEQYGWMKGPLWFEPRTFTIEEYRARVAHLLTQDIDVLIAQTERIRYEREEQYRAFLERYHPSIALHTLANALRAFIWLRTRTTEVSDHLFFMGATRLFPVIAARLGQGLHEVMMFSSEELQQALLGTGSLTDALLKERLTGYAIVRMDGQMWTYQGEEATRLQEEASHSFSSEHCLTEGQELVRGRTAAPGTVVGRVRVITSYEQVPLLEVGEVMVTTMTLPEYTAAMEKACAFVTDEGGVTCHAAIMAREMCKPCVIGTGNATRLLHTGDLVRVEADQGIVRLLPANELS